MSLIYYMESTCVRVAGSGGGRKRRGAHHHQQVRTAGHYRRQSAAPTELKERRGRRRSRQPQAVVQRHAVADGAAFRAQAQRGVDPTVLLHLLAYK